MEVVEGSRKVGWRFVEGLSSPMWSEAVPLEEDLAGLDVHLLDYTVEHDTLYGTSDGGEVPLYFTVDRDQRGILGR